MARVTEPQFDTRVGAYGIVVQNDHILLAHWHTGRAKSWTLPGGGLDLGESPADAAVREIREETGYDVHLDRLLGIDSEHFRARQRMDGRKKPLHALRIVYAARVVGGDLRREVGGSTDDARWVALDEVRDLRRVRLVDAGLAMWRDGVSRQAE